jgi:hypothetical protein
MLAESDWLTCAEPRRMLRHLRQSRGLGCDLRSFIGRRDDLLPRKLRLFVAAACRRVWPWLTNGRARALVELSERLAEAPRARLDRQTALAGFDGGGYPGGQLVTLLRALTSPIGRALGELRCLVGSAAANVTAEKKVRPGARAAVMAAEAVAQCGLLRCVIGNPFRAASLEPSCRTPMAVAIARAACEDGDFGSLPVLGDVLEDAGCTDADILAHCRGPGPHGRGCFVIDWLLRKNRSAI